ncbi:unnamed protein product [Caretta caretta]
MRCLQPLQHTNHNPHQANGYQANGYHSDITMPVSQRANVRAGENDGVLIYFFVVRPSFPKASEKRKNPKEADHVRGRQFLGMDAVCHLSGTFHFAWVRWALRRWNDRGRFQ